MNIAKTIKCLFRDKMLVENVIATNNLCLVRDKMPRVATYSVPYGTNWMVGRYNFYQYQIPNGINFNS